MHGIDTQYQISTMVRGKKILKLANWYKFCSTRPRISLLDGYQKMIGRLFQGR